MSTRLNFLGISLVLYFSLNTYSQVPIGLNEGMMGNTGVAAFASTAASYYNPSLLTEKTENSFSIGGYSFNIIQSEQNDLKMNSTTLSPSYVSSLQRFENFVHEFALANNFNIESKNSNSDSTGGLFKQNLKYSNLFLSYSFAFPALPMGFQVLGSYTNLESDGSYFLENSTSTTVGQIGSYVKKLDGMMNISGHHRFGGYQFGYAYTSRGLKIFESKTGDSVISSYSKISKDLTIIREDSKASVESFGQKFLFGHSFLVGDHEYSTDSMFLENSDLTHSYDWRQSFGYRVKFDNGMHYMAGVNHLISDQVKWFGQAIFVSTGFSWLKRSYRSAVGLFYSKNEVDNKMTSFGITFNNEFSY